MLSNLYARLRAVAYVLCGKPVMYRVRTTGDVPLAGPVLSVECERIPEPQRPINEVFAGSFVAGF